MTPERRGESRLCDGELLHGVELRLTKVEAFAAEIDKRADERREADDKLHTERSKALDLQAKEYERRLTDLNHAHENAVKDLATYVPRETYEAYIKELGIWRVGVDKDMNTQKGKDASKAAMVALALAVVGVLLGIASFGLAAIGLYLRFVGK